MIDYDYLFGLSILKYLDMDLKKDEIEKFRSNFEFFYDIRLKMPGKFDVISLLTVVKHAYCSTISTCDSDLESDIRGEFTKRVVNSDLLLKIKNGISLDEHAFIIYLN